MKNCSRLVLLLWMCLAVWLPSGFAQGAAPRINKISVRFVGPLPVSEDFVRANVRLKVGEPFSRPAADEDVKDLYSTGYFYKINVAAEANAGGVDITYVVQGKPILVDPVNIVGNVMMSTRKIRKKITSKVGQPLDERKLFDDAQSIKEMYEKAGYQKTTVTAQITGIDEGVGHGRAAIVIHETPKIKIKDIVFVNAVDATQRQLRHVFKTRRRWMFSWLTGSGVLKEDQFETDKDTLVEFYQNKGYIDFAIQDIKFDYINPKWMVIRVILSPGRQYKVGTLTIKGNTIYTTNDFLQGVKINRTLMRLKLAPGTIFKPSQFNDDQDTIRDMYGAKGYLDQQQHGTTIISAASLPNPATGTIDLAYDIQEGEKCYIEKVIIKGNVKTKDRVLRRELAVYPGEVYDMVRVKISQQKLEGLEYFSKVDAQAQDTDIPNHKDMVLNVEEKSTGNFTIGAGFSTVESLVGNVEVRQGNFDLSNPPTFTGAGQKIQLNLSVGLLLQNYDLHFIEPWFLGKRLIFDFDLYHRFNFYNALHGDYSYTTDGGTISLTKALGNQFLKGSVSYTLENVHVSIAPNYFPYDTTNYFATGGGLYEGENYTGPLVSSNIISERGTYFISEVGTSLEYDTRQGLRLPTGGQDTSISASVATPPGNTEFYKFELRSHWFFTGFATNQILELAGRTGVISPWNGTDRVPIFERFTLGGLYSLRGYRYETVGPLDNLGEALGGDTYWFASAEYSIPLISIVRYSFFYDIGNVYADPFSLRRAPGTQFFNDDVGMGLIIVLPIGGGTPLRLDYGVPIVHNSTASRFGRFQFGFGYSRPF